MVRNVKYIGGFNVNNLKSYDENVKLIYDLSISKMSNYEKTNQYIFTQHNSNEIKVYELLKKVPKYPKPFYKGDIVECKEHGRGKIIKIVAGGYMRIEVLFDNGKIEMYTYHGYKYTNTTRKYPRNVNLEFLHDKLVKINESNT